MLINKILKTLNYTNNIILEFIQFENINEHKNICQTCYINYTLYININESIRYIKNNNISDKDIILFIYLKRIKKIFEIIFEIYKNSPKIKLIFNKLDEIIRLEPMDDNNPCFMFQEKCPFNLDLGDFDSSESKCPSDLDLGDFNSSESSRIDIKSLFKFDDMNVDEYFKLESFDYLPVLSNEDDNSNNINKYFV